MKFLGLNIDYNEKPCLDLDFIPFYKFKKAYEALASIDFAFALERADGQIANCQLKVIGGAEFFATDLYYLERLIKTMLWVKGGYKLYLQGDESLAQAVAEYFSASGGRAFDYKFMSIVNEREFEVVLTDQLPREKNLAMAVGRHLNGCRIGFDAGGSDRKVSAVIDGEPVYSEEVVWFPKVESNPDYHYEEILKAMQVAASKMPRVDAIGVSSAGIYINNRTMSASLFLKVSETDFETKVKDIYIRAAKEFGNVPLVVCNDGDVTALAGAMSLGENNILGIAMGTSEAVGYVDQDGLVKGWLNELAFMPVDMNPAAMEDEWSGDIGVGCKYFSQDAVIKLAPRIGIELDPQLSPAEKLKVVQGLMQNDDERAVKVYQTIGSYLAHTLPMYYELYGFKHLLLLGRVMSGKGGDTILAETNRILALEYPELAKKIIPSLPDEKFRRVGQAVAAASLPEL